MMIDHAQGKMRAIRKKIISDMKAIGVVRMTTPIDRVQSLDDYTLLSTSKPLSS